MKKTAVLLAMLFCFGCSYGGETLKTWVADPHYAQHQQKLDDLEKSYLKGTMGYSQYSTQKKQLEDDYTKEVKEREDKIHQ